jgi:Na+-exporting ATPase
MVLLPIHSPPQIFFRNFSVNPKWGLTEARAQEILLRNGPNLLKPPQQPSRLKIFLAQVLNAMTIVLIAATAVSFAIMDWISGGVIVLLVVINVYVGYSRERRLPLVTARYL